VLYRRAAFCCASLWPKGLDAKNFHKQMCPVYDETHLSRKEVHNWVEKVSQGRSKVADERRCESGWDNSQKISMQRDKCINVGGQYVEKFYFQVRISYVLSFILICDLFTDCPSYYRNMSNDGGLVAAGTTSGSHRQRSCLFRVTLLVISETILVFSNGDSGLLLGLQVLTTQC
jgi:hypothetical protein